MIIGIDASLACREKRTGVESYAFHIITSLVAVIPPDVEVRLYSDREFPSDFKKNLPVSWKQILLSWPPRYLWTQVRLSFEMLIHAPDILFIPGHVEPIIHPRCSVMMVHDVAAWRFPDAYSRFDRWYTLNRTLKALSNNPLLLTPSVFTAQELKALASQRKTQKYAEIRVVPHGLIDKTLHTSNSFVDTSVFLTHGINLSEPYILCIGRVEYKKNIDTIIRAFEQFKIANSNYASTRLILVGKPGHGYEAIQKLISASPYNTQIVETDWLPDEHVSLFLQNATALLFVSRYEGFGLPVLEALSCGVPVIASKGVGLEEVGGSLCTYVSGDDEQGIADAIKQCLSEHSTDRRKFLEQGKTWVKKFSWVRSGEETYQALLRAYTIAGKH